jgi:nucleoside-diphosphate-sugar epimerase
VKIAITGGAGFVGGHLTKQLRAAGHEVAVFTRQSPASDLAGFDALIHAAWDFAKPESNIPASAALFERAHNAGVRRLIFISSLSAFEGCKSRYGAAKLAVEKIAASFGGCNVRLGFVLDNSNRGLSGSLKKLAALPIVPLPGGGHPILYRFEADELGPPFLRLLDRCPGSPVNLANPKSVTLADLMRRFASEQNRKPLFLPIPWRLLWLPLRALEALGLRLNFRSDSLISLMNQNPAPGTLTRTADTQSDPDSPRDSPDSTRKTAPHPPKS